jgi:large subunit ribosomal protein L35
MPKNKPRKAMLKRIRFTKTGRVKFRRACGRHLRSHKSGKLLRSYRQPAYAGGSEAKRVRALLFRAVGGGSSGGHRAADSTEQE